MRTRSESLDDILADVRAHRHWKWAVDNYTDVVRQVIVATGARSVLEIGGGRRPLFGREEVAALGVDYTVNDISQAELDRAPDYVSQARFDVGTQDADAIAPFRRRYDLVFSKWVFEHIRDNRQSYANVAALLRPGGYCLNFHPLLFTVPFLLNRAMPDAASRRLLSFLFPSRNDSGGTPKFPAYYDRCAITRRSQQMIEQCGFGYVEFFPFFGHEYFKRFPGIRELGAAFHDLVERRNVRLLASLAYVVARKGSVAGVEAGGWER
jgi:SAM-dependent methyltransferase